ncbi:uncharacterized protein LOC109600787 [Aethina tumida]|uniref:uncharacterized protein LOC109600787 n=1 Tax=Aethina tumida TaxID=116153 RepID=UPI00096B0863|nr:uncharacterized protein LOC109600787 [Aethina tumida]
MGKRLCPFGDNDQASKQQVINNNEDTKTRKIKSSEAERTLQLLYHGASQENESSNYANKCVECTSNPLTKCWYCNKDLCQYCIGKCEKCSENFCTDCSFQVYEAEDTNLICYSCY